MLHSQALLQKFAWTEGQRTQFRAARAAQCYSELQREALLAEPVFCFETACKALYWSMLVYRIQARRFSTDGLAVCRITVSAGSAR